MHNSPNCHSNKTTDATVIAISVTCTTFSNTVGQLYFLGNWHDIKITEYEQAKLSLDYPAIALGSLSTGFRLFLSRFATYCYNVDRSVSDIGHPSECTY